MIRKSIVKFIGCLIFPFYMVYHLCTRQAYYVTGTFIDKAGKRMFCKTIFTTSLNRLPIHNLAEKMGEEFGIDKPVLILNFVKIGWNQAKYMAAKQDGVEIILDGLE